MLDKTKASAKMILQSYHSLKTCNIEVTHIKGYPISSRIYIS